MVWQMRSYSNVIQVDPTVNTTNSDLTLVVTMNISSSLRSSKSVYVRINPSDIRANLVPLETSTISNGSEQDLPLNPGLYSFDLDEDSFNASVTHSSLSQSLLIAHLL